MHGPAPAHPPYRPPARGTVVTLRVLFVAATVLSVGFLAWAALLRAALVQRKPLGWWLFGADLALLVLVLASGTYPEADWRSDVQAGVVVLQMVGAVAYYLVVDIRAVRAAGNGPRHGAGYGPGQGPVPGGGYGYPATAYPGGPAGHPAAAPGHPPAAPSPYGPPPAPAPVHLQATQPYAAPAAAPAPQAPPPYGPPQGGYPQGQAPERPQRIDRVRAELDELSDYLRKEEGR